MAITGIDTIEGKQIIAAGAVSAKSAEMAYNDENGNPITGYLTAVPEGYATTEDLTAYQLTADMTGYQVAGDYYSASNPSGFITGVDLSDYATTAQLADKQDITGMTAYQPVGNYQTAGDYLTTADSANFYTTANESGFITSVPAGTMNESAFGYDANNKISGYNGSAFAGGSDVPEGTMNESGLEYDTSGNISAYSGSAFAAQLPEEEEVEFEELDLSTYLQNTDLTITDGKVTEISGVPLSAGDELPESVSAATDYITATSANIDSTINNVSANSGVWGGSALPISAGPGIKFEMVNGILVASTDETVIWEGTAFTPAGSENPMLATAALSESITNFDKIRLDFSGGFFFTDSVLLAHPVTSTLCYLMVKKEQSNNGVYIGTHYRFSNDTTLSGFCSYGDTQNVNAMTGGYWGYGGVIRVVGINRIAGGE